MFTLLKPQRLPMLKQKIVTYSSKREGPCVEVCGNRLRTCLGDQLN